MYIKSYIRNGLFREKFYVNAVDWPGNCPGNNKRKASIYRKSNVVIIILFAAIVNIEKAGGDYKEDIEGDDQPVKPRAEIGLLRIQFGDNENQQIDESQQGHGEVKEKLLTYSDLRNTIFLNGHRFRETNVVYE